MTAKKTAKKKPVAKQDTSRYIVLAEGEVQMFYPEGASAFDDVGEKVLTYNQAVKVIEDLAEEEGDIDACNRSEIEVYKVTHVDLTIDYPVVKATVKLG